MSALALLLSAMFTPLLGTFVPKSLVVTHACCIAHSSSRSWQRLELWRRGQGSSGFSYQVASYWPCFFPSCTCTCTYVDK